MPEIKVSKGNDDENKNDMVQVHSLQTQESVVDDAEDDDDFME